MARKREAAFVRPNGMRQTALAIAGLLGILSGCGNEPERTAPASSSASPTRETTTLLAPALPPDAPLSDILAHPDPLERARRVAEILSTSGPERLRELTAAFEAAPLPWGDSEYALFASWWARFDPAAAMAYCYQDAMRMRNPRALREVIRVWAHKDPQAVIKSGWLNSMSVEVGGLDPEMLEPFVIGWFESKQPGLDGWLHGLDLNSKTSAIGAYMRMRVLADGARPALEWTRTAPFDPATQRLLLASGLNVVARFEPELAVEWLAIAQKDGIDTRTFTARISRGWAQSDPQAAMEWLTKQELEFSESVRAINDVAATWLERDPKDVERWLEENKDTGWLDMIRKQWLFHHIKSKRYDVDWNDMMARVGKFVTDEPRQANYLWVFQRWNVYDPDAAAAWLEKNKDLLGDKLQYAHQLYADDRKEIEKILAERRGESAETPTPPAGTTAD